MNITFLGTSSGVPSLTRNVSSLALKLSQSSEVWLFDCGEGTPVSYTHLRAHETEADLVCRLLLEKNSPSMVKGIDLSDLILKLFFFDIKTLIIGSLDAKTL